VGRWVVSFPPAPVCRDFLGARVFQLIPLLIMLFGVVDPDLYALRLFALLLACMCG
jgi:hypothetical protein